jgi:hypothetical protein
MSDKMSKFHQRGPDQFLNILRLLQILLFPLATFGFGTPSALASGTLDWNADKGKVSADLKSEDLLPILREIAVASHWHVFVEPDALHPISAKFKNLAPGEALHFLLSDLNFALVPEPGAASKLYVFRTDRKNATQAVQPRTPAKWDTKSKPIRNELIVRLKPGQKIDEIARLLGAKVVGHLDDLNAYRLQFDNEAAAETARQQLNNNPDVGSVENNYQVDRPQSPQSASGGASLPQLELKPPTGGGRPTIGLIDTAVQPLGGGLDDFILKQLSVSGQSQLDPDTPSHGTSMAETMLRTLQTLGDGKTSWQILPVDAFGGNENANTFAIAQAITMAVNNGANPINLSLGGADDSQVLRDVISEATQKYGIVFYAAKGNTPVTTPFYPASDPGVTSVTALEPSGSVAPWANQAPISSIGARGEVLVSFNGQTFDVEGTSPATAIATGTAAALMEQNSLSATQANGQLIKRPTPTTLPGK